MKTLIKILLFLFFLQGFAQNPAYLPDGYRVNALSDPPSSPKLSQVYYDLEDLSYYQWDGTNWIMIGSSYTFSDTGEINLTSTDNDVTASLVAGSIDETKLDASVNASLDLADSATQPGDLSGFVTLPTDQTITGLKTFDNNLIIEDNLYIGSSSPVSGSKLHVNKISSDGSASVASFINNENTLTGSSSDITYGSINRTFFSGTGTTGEIWGSQSIGRNSGAGTSGTLIGSNSLAELSGSGTSSNLYGSYSDATINGSGSSTTTTALGGWDRVEINNPLSSVENIYGTYSNVDLIGGSVDQAVASFLDFDFVTEDAADVDVNNLYYIKANADNLPTVTGEAYFIKSEVDLPSFFEGDITSNGSGTFGGEGINGTVSEDTGGITAANSWKIGKNTQGTYLNLVNSSGGTTNAILRSYESGGVQLVLREGGITAAGNAEFSGTVSGDDPVNDDDFVTKGYGDANYGGTPYLKYVALITQSGTSAPTAHVLENTLGGTVVWSRTSTGVYRATLAGAFTENKTALYATEGAPANGSVINEVRFFRVNADYILLNTRGNDALVDSNIADLTVEIRVYP